MYLLSGGQIKCFCFHLETHSVSLTRLLQHYCGYWNHALFLCMNIWAALCKYFHIGMLTCGGMFQWAVLWAWQSLIFDKVSLCYFRDLIYAQSACNTPKRKQKIKSHHMTPLKYIFPTKIKHDILLRYNTIRLFLKIILRYMYEMNENAAVDLKLFLRLAPGH